MAGADTPMMQQYKQVKSENPGHLLFYRMGDFYEMFGDDAIIASSILQITLTRRRSSKDEEGIPMCGVPYHAAEGYIAKLLKNGQKVALCEQVETPAEAKARGGHKALVKRDVVRRFTGGTLTEDSMLQAQESNFLAAFGQVGNDFALGWLEISTGSFYIADVKEQNITNEISRLNPNEILTTETVSEKYIDQLKLWEHIITETPSFYFDSKRGEEELQTTFDMADITALNLDNRAQAAVCGALLQYVKQTQVGKLPTFKQPHVVRSNTFMHIDAATRHNLEITQTLKGERKGSLLHSLDRTVTSAGSRMLSQWLMAPLNNLSAIQNRQDIIELLKNDAPLRSEIQQTLKSTADMGRALSRISLGRGGPRDLGTLRNTLNTFPDVQSLLSRLTKNLTPLVELQEVNENLTGFDALNTTLHKALDMDNLPMLARDGGFVLTGYCSDLDKYKELSTNGMSMLKALEAREQEALGVSNLRIKYNKVWGYFIEISKSHVNKVPEHYIHRQTTTNAQRFSTTELMELERDYSAAEAKSLQREQEVFTELTELVNNQGGILLMAAESLAKLDVFAATAEVAEQQNYCKPTMDSSTAYNIVGGRHPVVEQTVDQFIANDTNLGDGQLWLVTGPNMAGKSTFLRQNALIAVLAHCGFFVPAKSVHMGLVDKIFTRIGAADDLARGQSTFMVEMVETATILNNATDRSLVVLDEIGRGTATFDGMSIAWACAEHLAAKIKARGLFATHYHELTELSDAHGNMTCHHVSVKEWEGDIVFLHQVKDGVSPGSYGIHVGKLAGLPKDVTTRAETILKKLEQGGHKQGLQMPTNELPLFGAIVNQPDPEPSKVETELTDINPDELTPRQAHDMLYRLKDLL